MFRLAVEGRGTRSPIRTHKTSTPADRPSAMSSPWVWASDPHSQLPPAMPPKAAI
ncbi:hypothetical protein D3C80_2134210 [compost metagenome]